MQKAEKVLNSSKKIIIEIKQLQNLIFIIFRTLSYFLTSFQLNSVSFLCAQV